MINIILKDIRVLLRDKATLFLIILFPIMLVFLLGNLLANLDTSDEEIGSMKVYYSVELTDSNEKVSAQSYIENLKDNDSIKLIEEKDKKKSVDKVNSGEIAAYVRFLDNMEIDLYEGLDDIQNRAINIMLNSYLSQASSIKTLEKKNPDKLANISNIDFDGAVKDKELGYKRTMLDYYAVAMVVMILFMGGAIGGASTVYDNRMNGTLKRTLITPKSRTNIYIQTILGNIPQTLIQVIAIMIPSILVFNANYAQNMSDNIILIIMFVVLGASINALFTIVGIYVKHNPTMVIMPILWIMMFLSGTFSKEIYIEGVSNNMPIWFVQKAAFELTVFGRPEQCFMVMGVSLVVFVLSAIVGSLLYKRKETFPC